MEMEFWSTGIYLGNVYWEYSNLDRNLKYKISYWYDYCKGNYIYEIYDLKKKLIVEKNSIPYTEDEEKYTIKKFKDFLKILEDKKIDKYKPFIEV